MKTTYGDVAIELHEHVALVEIRRPPNNFFDEILIGDLAEAFEALDQHDPCRALVVAAAGKNFCAGANFGYARGEQEGAPPNVKPLYAQAARLFACRKPIVAAVQGAAIGGGLGVALVADFRVVSSRDALCGQFCQAGDSSRFWLDLYAAAADRRAAGGAAVFDRAQAGRRCGG